MDLRTAAIEHRWVSCAPHRGQELRLFLAANDLLPRAASSEEWTAFLTWAQEHFNQQDPQFQIRFNAALEGLIQAAEGSTPEDEGRQFLGWSENLWLLAGSKKEP